MFILLPKFDPNEESFPKWYMNQYLIGNTRPEIEKAISQTGIDPELYETYRLEPMSLFMNRHRLKSQWQKDNKDKYNAKQRVQRKKWYEATKEKRREYAREYYRKKKLQQKDNK